jgi:hypothetical protein
VTFVVPPVRGWRPVGSLAAGGGSDAPEEVDWRPSAIAGVLLAVYATIVATSALAVSTRNIVSIRTQAAATT